MNVVEFRPEHLRLLLDAGGAAYAGVREVMAVPGYGETLAAAGKSWSGFDGGQIVGCGGLATEHPACVTAWTLLNPELSGRRMLAIDRIARRVLASCPTRRVQAHADLSFKPALRWLDKLGFEYEGTLRAYSPCGRDMALFSRVVLP
jgi:RimJ/RimL family protein N-acetyltransferase